MVKTSDLINRVYQVLMPIFVVALAVQTTITTLDNRKLKSQLQVKWTRPGTATQMAPLDILKAGEKIAPFSAPDLSGAPVQVAGLGSAKKTLLLAFTTTCPACKANSPNWVNLYDKVDKSRWDVIGLSLDDPEKTKAYVAEKGFKFPVLALKDKKEISSQLKIRRIPMTIAISEKQTVDGVWIGNLEKQWPDVEKKIGMTK